MKRQSLILLFLSLLFFGCGYPTYKSNGFEASKSSIKVIAIIPYQITFNMGHFPKDMTDQDLRDYEEKASYEAQSQTFDWLTKKPEKYSVTFQDIDITNEQLKKAKINYRKLHFADKAKLCKYLGVDAVFSGSLALQKPMSDIEILGRTLIGAGSVSRNVDAFFYIHDTKNEILWRWYSNESRSNNMKTLIAILMKTSARKFPYKKS